MKTVKVHTLKQGDHFIFMWDYDKPSPYVYVVTELMKHSWIECVCLQTGKDFAVGRDCDVILVTVDLKLKFKREEKVVDLTRKCGSCVYASTKNKRMFINHASYVRCDNPNRRFRDESSAYRARTTRCCQCYKPKEGFDERT